MKKILTIIFLLAACFQFSFAQVDVEHKGQAKTDITPKEVENRENSLLWEISGKGLEAPSYLYGTIHMIGKDDYFLTDETKASIDKSERVTFEINMEEMNNMATMFALIGKIMMPDGMTLSDLLSEEDYAFVKARFNEMGFPALMMGMLEKVKPMFLTTFASGDLSPGAMQSGEIVSYEMEFMKMAQETEKEMAGLETIEFQMSVFDSIPYKAQAEMLVESLKAETADSYDFKIMVDLYKNQDLAGMMEIFASEEGGLGEYDDILLNQRNRNWIPVMEGMMKDKITFFAVGAGHLGGEEGVINLLRKEGYTLKPLRNFYEKPGPSKDLPKKEKGELKKTDPKINVSPSKENN